MQTEPEVLTDHTEMICSTSIERIITGRNTALEQIDTLIRQLDAISTLTNSIGGGTVKDWGMRPGHRYDCWFTEKPEIAMKAITRSIDRDIWRDLMNKSGMLSLMNGTTAWKKKIFLPSAKATSSVRLSNSIKIRERYLNAASSTHSKA